MIKNTKLKNMARRNLTQEMILEFFHGDQFEVSKVKPVRNSHRTWLNKPEGGLWTSPEDSPLRWKDFCKDWRDPGQKSKLRLKPESKIYVLDDWDDFYDLPTKEISGPLGPEKIVDWQELANQGFQAFHLTNEGAMKFHLDAPKGYADFNTWDVETVYILDPNCIEEIV